MTLRLTPRQQQILKLIQQSIQRTGFPPTRAEIAKQLGFKSANAAEDHLKALAKKGAITLTAGTSRGIRLHSEFVQAEVTSSHQSQTNYSNTTLSAIDSWVANTLSLPIIGRVAAGNPVLAQENIEKAIQVSTTLFNTTPDYLLRVKGQSMKDVGILDGDLLAVKKTQVARNGQIVVARINDEVTVKNLILTNGHVELHPENPDFEPIIITQTDDFAIEGLAVGLLRSFH